MKKRLAILLIVILIGLNNYGCIALWVAGGAAAGVAGTNIYNQYRDCTYCKKKIKKEATVCPHCQRDINPIVDSS
jgi:hypothetical protein